MSKIAVLIPCYNEALTIAKVIRDSRAALPEAEIFVFDNNSTDDTASIARSEGATVCYEKKQGKGNVIKTMFEQVEADCYVMVDGDDTYGMQDAGKMCDLVLNDGVDMVIGDRLSGAYFSENKRPFHGIGNKLVKAEVNLFFGAHISDVMTGFRAFSRRFVKSFPISSKGFEIETEMSIFAVENKFKLASVDIEYRDRPEGSSSKLNTTVDGLKVLLTIYNFFRKYKPMTFNLIITLILMIPASILLGLFISSSLGAGEVSGLPLGMAGGVFGLCALFHFVNGLIRHFKKKKSKALFQKKLKEL